MRMLNTCFALLSANDKCEHTSMAVPSISFLKRAVSRLPTRRSHSFKGLKGKYKAQGNDNHWRICFEETDQ